MVRATFLAYLHLVLKFYVASTPPHLHVHLSSFMCLMYAAHSHFLKGLDQMAVDNIFCFGPECFFKAWVWKAYGPAAGTDPLMICAKFPYILPHNDKTVIVFMKGFQRGYEEVSWIHSLPWCVPWGEPGGNPFIYWHAKTVIWWSAVHRPSMMDCPEIHYFDKVGTHVKVKSLDGYPFTLNGFKKRAADQREDEYQAREVTREQLVKRLRCTDLCSLVGEFISDKPL